MKILPLLALAAAEPLPWCSRTHVLQPLAIDARAEPFMAEG